MSGTIRSNSVSSHRRLTPDGSEGPNSCPAQTAWYRIGKWLRFIFFFAVVARIIALNLSPLSTTVPRPAAVGNSTITAGHQHGERCFTAIFSWKRRNKSIKLNTRRVPAGNRFAVMWSIGAGKPQGSVGAVRPLILYPMYKWERFCRKMFIFKEREQVLDSVKYFFWRTAVKASISLSILFELTYLTLFLIDKSPSQSETKILITSILVELCSDPLNHETILNVQNKSFSLFEGLLL